MEIDAKSPQGNAMCIVAAVKTLLTEVGREDEWAEISDRMYSGDYNNLCDVAEEVTHGSIKVVNRA